MAQPFIMYVPVYTWYIPPRSLHFHSCTHILYVPRRQLRPSADDRQLLSLSWLHCCCMLHVSSVQHYIDYTSDGTSGISLRCASNYRVFAICCNEYDNPNPDYYFRITTLRYEYNMIVVYKAVPTMQQHGTYEYVQ